MTRKNTNLDREELESLGRRTLDQLISAIEENDRKRSEKLARRMYQEFLGMHDLYRDWLTDLFSFIGRKYGDEVLSESMETTVAHMTNRLAPFYEGKSAEDRIRILAAGLRGHLHAFEVQEDEEKFTIIAHCCGSGGRLITEGKYEAPHHFLKVEKPQEMTFHRPDFPVYCIHCWFQNLSPAGESGEPLFITEPAENPGVEPCRIYLYKK